jgi:hypothetical protein
MATARQRGRLRHHRHIRRSFRHVVLDKPGHPSRVLHVYLDGDGTPWDGNTAAVDPTPRNTLVLGLMRLDDRPERPSVTRTRHDQTHEACHEEAHACFLTSAVSGRALASDATAASFRCDR